MEPYAFRADVALNVELVEVGTQAGQRGHLAAGVVKVATLDVDGAALQVITRRGAADGFINLLRPIAAVDDNRLTSQREAELLEGFCYLNEIIYDYGWWRVIDVLNVRDTKLLQTEMFSQF